MFMAHASRAAVQGAGLLCSAVALLLSLFVFVDAAANESTGVLLAFLTPAPMVGTCNASCTTNKAFPCVYTPFYPVWFTKDGKYSWRAPYANGTGAEVGQGMILSEVSEKRWRNGTWTARWYGGNSYEPDLLRVTHCACYYLVGTGLGKPFLLHNYRVKEALNTSHLPVEDVCDLYHVDCPENTASARSRFGSPWVESYMGCQQ